MYNLYIKYERNEYMTEKKSTFIDRMNYTGGVETDDLMSKEEREAFAKMSPQQQHKFMNEVIIPRAINIQ